MDNFFESSKLELDVIQSVKRTKSGKGYILEGISTTLFLWNSDKRLEHLLQAIASWLDTGEGFVIEYVKDKTAKGGFILRKAVSKDKPVKVKWIETPYGYSIREEEVDQNPFL